MTNWLDIANTFVNLETMRRVGDISREQQMVSNNLLVTEQQKQRDNALLSQLVDILVKVRKFIGDNQFLDAFLSSGIGIIIFNQSYSQIVNAEIRIKASDIQFKLLETIHSFAFDSSLKTKLQSAVTQYLLSFHNLILDALSELKQPECVSITSQHIKNNILHTGDYVFTEKDLWLNGTLFFKKETLYQVTDIVQDIGLGGFALEVEDKNYFVYFAAKGDESRWAENFLFFSPSAPSFYKEIKSWKICDRLFGNEFWEQNAKSLLTEIPDIYNRSLEESRITRQNLHDIIIKYTNIKNEILFKTLQTRKKEHIERQQILVLKLSARKPIVVIMLSLIILFSIIIILFGR